jgi:methanethiol S-methyltransferase
MYVHLAHTEEAEARLKFGEAYVRYAARVPGWFPHLRRRGTQSGTA